MPGCCFRGTDADRDDLAEDAFELCVGDPFWAAFCGAASGTSPSSSVGATVPPESLTGIPGSGMSFFAPLIFLLLKSAAADFLLDDLSLDDFSLGCGGGATDSLMLRGSAATAVS